MKIIGAGMSGLLAAQYFRSIKPTVYEIQDSLPNNHKALLRFRSAAVQELTGIKFKKVFVQKGAVMDDKMYDTTNIHFNNKYSYKIFGCIRSRSIVNLDSCERYIAPDNFIERLSHGINIEYGCNSYDIFKSQMEDPSTPLISTIPIPSLIEILGYKAKSNIKLVRIPITVMRANLVEDCDVYQTMYYPEPHFPFYRISICGDLVIAESTYNIDDNDIEDAGMLLEHAIEHHFGIESEFNNHEVIVQENGKLMEHSGNDLKEFIGWASKTYNIYSLGRWATHRQILMDDVVKDIHIIDALMHNSYKG